MNSQDKRFLKAFQQVSQDRPPFWLMRQAGRYLPEYREIRKTAKNFLNFCYTPDLAVEVTLQPLRRYNFDAAILFCDILVIPDALGQKVEFKEGEGPVLEPIRNLKDLSKLSMGGIHDHLAPVYETVRRLSKEIPEETALIGFAGAPWTVATYMVEGRGGTDYSTTKGWAYSAPDEFAVLIDLLVKSTSAYLLAQIRNGAEVVQLFDTWAGVLPESQFKKWVIEPTKEIVANIKSEFPNVPVMGFPKGAGGLYLDFVKETGVDGVSLDTSMPLSWAAKNLQPHCLVQGNLDNQMVVAGGKTMEVEIKNILSTLGDGKFIFNLGHGIVPQTPPEHVGKLAEIVHGWKK
ncbi:MAG: uroporphyrinogen decarboxylase [Rhodospirillales bacterium]|nr:uroporphyrinogen decarboxylase [Rhodospirillales bacterium]